MPAQNALGRQGGGHAWAKPMHLLPWRVASMSQPARNLLPFKLPPNPMPHPLRLQGLNNLAVVYTQQGRAQEALQLLQAAVMAAPDYAEAHNNLGVLQVGSCVCHVPLLFLICLHEVAAGWGGTSHRSVARVCDMHGIRAAWHGMAWHGVAWA